MVGMMFSVRLHRSSYRARGRAQSAGHPHAVANVEVEPGRAASGKQRRTNAKGTEAGDDGVGRAEALRADAVAARIGVVEEPARKDEEGWASVGKRRCASSSETRYTHQRVSGAVPRRKKGSILARLPRQKVGDGEGADRGAGAVEEHVVDAEVGAAEELGSEDDEVRPDGAEAEARGGGGDEEESRLREWVRRGRVGGMAEGSGERRVGEGEGSGEGGQRTGEGEGSRNREAGREGLVRVRAAGTERRG